MTRTARHILGLLLSVMLIFGMLPFTASATGETPIKPGQSVSGTLSRENPVWTYLVSGMETSNCWGICLTVTVADTSKYEIWLTEQISNNIDSIQTKEFIPSTQNRYLTHNSNGFVFKSPVNKYAIEEYLYTISVPEYFWEDVPSSTEFSFTLELYQKDEEGTNAFSDVSSSDWFYEATDFVVKKGLFQGTGANKFSPNTSMTRGMFVTVLGRLEGLDPSLYGNKSFSDVDTGIYYGPYVAWASSEGIVNGIDSENFGPNREISRQDLITVLYRYLSYKGGSSSLGDFGSMYDFSDHSDISNYAAGAMNWGISHGVINGLGNNKLSPRTSTTRAQVAKILCTAYGLLGVDEDKTVPEDFGKLMDTVSTAFKDKLAALTSAGESVSSATVMSEMYNAAQEYEESGYIKDLTSDDQGVFFTYADGTPGGIVMELPEADTANACALSFVPEGADEAAESISSGNGETTAKLMDNSGNNVIGSNKVLFGLGFQYSSSSEFETYMGLKDKIKNSDKGLELTEKYMTVADFKTLNNYGAVFLSMPNSWVTNGTICLELKEKFDPSNDYLADRKAGRIGVFSKISPGNAKYFTDAEGYILSSTSYDYELNYVLFPEKFFAYYYNFGNLLPNSFIHLGFSSSITAYNMTNTLINSGAGCITGYSDTVRQKTDLAVMGTMIDTFLKTENNTVYDAYQAVIDKGLDVDSFTDTYYKNLQWEIGSRDVESRFDMHLNDSRGDLTLWGASETEPVNSPIKANGSFYNHKQTVLTISQATATFTNISDMNITGVKFKNVRKGSIPKSTCSIYKNKDFSDFSLAPGESYTFYLTFPSEMDRFGQIITAYTTGDPKSDSGWVKIPEEKWEIMEFSFEGLK